MLAVLTFPEAMTAALATGAKIARKGWNGAGQHVRMTSGIQRFRLATDNGVVFVDANPFMVLRNAAAEYVPWTPSQGDMMAVDWMVLS
jgi:hypothetical protein